MNRDHQAFFALVKAGLWEEDVELGKYGTTDYAEIMRLAEEQSVVGLVTAGVEHVTDVKIPQEHILQFIGQTLQMEQRNAAMNVFVDQLITKLCKADIYALLLKGQGIAQCYERPQWRTSGDVDLFLSDDNYEKAKALLMPLAGTVEPEATFKKHMGLTIDGWLVELHGTLRSGLSKRVDRALDNIQDNTFCGGGVRSCVIGQTRVFMLSIENDIAYVFSHILDHFYKGGIGLRQICDWLRLIWTYHDKLNAQVLESRIRQMGVMTEWNAFGAFAVEWLGMPSETMPFYTPAPQWHRKVIRIKDFIMEVGNFGHNRDNSYYNKKSFIVKKAISFGRRIKDLHHHARLFPMDSVRFFWGITVTGVNAAAKGM